MKIEVIVSRDCILNGKRKCADSCPLALAIQNTGYEDVEVHCETLSFIRNGVRYKGSLPAEARKFILDFDAGKGRKRVLKPFIFEMSARPKKSAKAKA